MPPHYDSGLTNMTRILSSRFVVDISSEQMVRLLDSLDQMVCMHDTEHLVYRGVDVSEDNTDRKDRGYPHWPKS